MRHPATTTRLAAWLVAGLVLTATGGTATAPAFPKGPSADGVKIIPDAWKTAPQKALTPAAIDQLLEKKLQADKRPLPPAVTDEQFIRRVTLDLIGKLPSAAQVDAFVKSTDAQKRAQLIDQLLASDDFARNWARYWRDVILSRATNQQVFVRIPRTAGLEAFLFEQLKENKSWAEITRALLMAEGALKVEEPTANGALGFLMCHTGPDAAVERAAETSRVFLGIQIQCAQCHDHPNDIWKRNQFHEFAAYFARTRERPIFNQELMRQAGIQLISAPGGEYRMPGLQDPRQTTAMHPRFLTGEGLTPGKSDLERRKTLADRITTKDNYWFSAAFINRIWGELMGQSFYQPVDAMGPLQEATYPDLLLALADSFRATDYNIKELYRVIANSQAYQRQMRMGEGSGEHLRFAGTYPTRLRAEALWEVLVATLGPFPEDNGPLPPRAQMMGGNLPRFLRPTLENLFKRAFDYDPSTRPDEVEGSVPQVLLLMNNQVLNRRMRATGDTPLAQILKDHASNDEAVRQVYLRTLSRKPTDRELQTCRDYIRQVGNRAEAFEDILWTLINSTEFQTKR
jgi:hypothetical protein